MGRSMKRLMFDMQTMTGRFQLCVNHDNGIIKYEIENHLLTNDYKTVKVQYIIEMMILIFLSHHLKCHIF